MAGGADSVGVTVICVEPGVIENGTEPSGRRMTSGARGGEPCGNVVRIIGCLIDVFMAPVAIGRQGGVVVIHMTVCAGDPGVCAGQRERRVVVVEGGRGPCGGVVADVTLLRETYRKVIRTGRTLKLCEVATDTGGRGQVVVAIGVALGALQTGVCPGERETGGGMIERRGSPVGRAMADLALLRET